MNWISVGAGVVVVGAGVVVVGAGVVVGFPSGPLSTAGLPRNSTDRCFLTSARSTVPRLDPTAGEEAAEPRRDALGWERREKWASWLKTQTDDQQRSELDHFFLDTLRDKINHGSCFGCWWGCGVARVDVRPVEALRSSVYEMAGVFDCGPRLADIFDARVDVATRFGSEC